MFKKQYCFCFLFDILFCCFLFLFVSSLYWNYYNNREFRPQLQYFFNSKTFQTEVFALKKTKLNLLLKENLKVEECFAKLILDTYFSDRYGKIFIEDKPDLRSRKKIGIEVTSCIPPEIRVKHKNWFLPIASERETNFRCLYKAIKRKLPKINNGSYANSLKYDLFIFSNLDIEGNLKRILRQVVFINNSFSVGFSYIYVVGYNKKIAIFDLKNKKYKKIDIEKNENLFLKKSQKMVFEGRLSKESNFKIRYNYHSI